MDDVGVRQWSPPLPAIVPGRGGLIPHPDGVENLALVARVGEGWRAEQLRYHPGPEPGL